MANMWRKRPRRAQFQPPRYVLTIDAGRVFVDRPIGATKAEYPFSEWVPGAREGMARLITQVGRENIAIIKGLKEGENEHFERFFIHEWLELHGAGEIGLDHHMVHIAYLEAKWKSAIALDSCLHIDDRLSVFAAFPLCHKIAKILFRPEQREIDQQSEAVKQLVIPAKEIDRYCDILWQKIVRVDDWEILPDVAIKLMKLMKEIAR